MLPASLQRYVVHSNMPEPLASQTFCLPDLGEGLAEAEIVAWHVVEGDRVVADQPLVTVETDKAIVDIPAPHAGHIQSIHGEVGAHLRVGDLLVTYAATGDLAKPDQDRGSVVGSLPTQPEARRVKASPKARQRAREMGVDLGVVAPTGAGGIVKIEDIEFAAQAKTGEGQLKGVRRSMARHMADAHLRVARASVTGEADITAWSGDPVLMLRLIRAVGKACLAQPLLNASFDDRALAVSPNVVVDLGLAMETADGLFVPVLRDINASELERLGTELERLKTAVVERTIKSDELRGQTITLSNFGSVGGLHDEMIVVPPQVAIVGAGRAFQRLSLVADQPVAHRFMPISISFDHRVVTGVEACHFLAALTADLELAS
jgi:pyruvate dehydrogenase E2 component (dihydrolipoamide acetyltransferase)